MTYASVILDIPTQALDSAYTYALPADLAHAQIGCAVLVPFGGRKAIGYVVGLSEEVPENVKRLKSIEAVLSESYFDEAGAELAFYLSERYIAPLSSCVRLLLPPGATPKMKRVAGAWEVLYPKVQQVDERWASRLPAADEYTPRKSAVKQIAILEALKQGDLKVADLSAEYGSVSAVIKALEAKGVIAVEERRRVRGAAEISSAFTKRIHERPVLTPDQSAALEVIGAAQQRASGEVVVLDGVTGSGKTEVFLCAIEEELKAGRNAIVLVPEISLTPQTVARFRGRFGDTVAVLHSRMSQGERFDQWDLIHSGEIRVVVGARSALFAPLANVGMIIIDEEHEGSYKQDQAPRYVTRDVAEWLVRRNGATLILGSATPSIEALHRAKTDDSWHQVVMASRYLISRWSIWRASSARAIARCSRRRFRMRSTKRSTKARKQSCCSTSVGSRSSCSAATAASCLNANPVRLRSPITKRAIGSFAITAVMRSLLPLPVPIVALLI